MQPTYTKPVVFINTWYQGLTNTMHDKTDIFTIPLDVEAVALVSRLSSSQQ